MYGYSLYGKNFFNLEDVERKNKHTYINDCKDYLHVNPCIILSEYGLITQEYTHQNPIGFRVEVEYPWGKRGKGFQSRTFSLEFIREKNNRGLKYIVHGCDFTTMMCEFFIEARSPELLAIRLNGMLSTLNYLGRFDEEENIIG